MRKNNVLKIMACVSSLNFGVAQAMMLALYPAIAMALHSDLTSILYCVSVGTFLFIVGSPFWSNTTSYLSRSRVIQVGIAGLCFSTLLIVFVIKNQDLNQHTKITLFLLSQIIYGLVASATIPAGQALQIQLTENKRYVNAAFMQTMSLNIGRIMGYALIVIYYNHFNTVLLCYSLSGIFVLISLFFCKEQNPEKYSKESQKISWLPEIYAIRWIIAMAFFYACYLETLLLSLATTIKVKFALDVLLVSGVNAKILLMISIGIFLGQYIGKKLIKESWRIGLSVGISTLFLGAIILIQATSYVMLWFAIGAMVMGLGIIPGFYLALLRTENEAHHYSKRAGIIAVAHTLGYTIGAIIAGYILQISTINIGYTLAAIAVFLGIVVARYTNTQKKIQLRSFHEPVIQTNE